MEGQDFKSHLWKNRLILLVSKSYTNESKKQWKELMKEKTELKDRKLVVYHISPNQVRSSQGNLDVQNKQLYSKFKPKNGIFEVRLIGLDGRVKYSSERYTSPKTLFDLIDSMPMRKAELKSKN